MRNPQKPLPYNEFIQLIIKALGSLLWYFYANISSIYKSLMHKNFYSQAKFPIFAGFTAVLKFCYAILN